MYGWAASARRQAPRPLSLIHICLRQYPDTDRATTILMCAHNEEESIDGAIRAVVEQQYPGDIRLLVIDNASTDGTREKTMEWVRRSGAHRVVEYLFCPQLGKANALNFGLEQDVYKRQVSGVMAPEVFSSRTLPVLVSTSFTSPCTRVCSPAVVWAKAAAGKMCIRDSLCTCR